MRITSMIKRALIWMLIVTIIGTTNFSAFAATSNVDAGISSTGNGWSSNPIVLNGKSYSCTVGLGCTSSGYATSSCNTDATSKRVHSSLTMKYLTKNDGYITVTGGYKSVSATTGSSKSNQLKPSGSYSSYVSYYSISGKVTVTVTDQDGTSRSYAYSPKLT